MAIAMSSAIGVDALPGTASRICETQKMTIAAATKQPTGIASGMRNFSRKPRCGRTVGACSPAPCSEPWASLCMIIGSVYRLRRVPCGRASWLRTGARQAHAAQFVLDVLPGELRQAPGVELLQGVGMVALLLVPPAEEDDGDDAEDDGAAEQLHDQPGE